MEADRPLRPPGDPPWDPDELVASLARLQEAEADEQVAWLRHLRSEPGARPFADLLERLAEPDPTPAVEIADRWTEAGHTEAQVAELLAQLCEEIDLDAGWTDWEDVADRSEVRLRLQTLAHVASIDEGLQGFLTFFFRASDPELYRWAALGLGRHRQAIAQGQSYVEDWASQHGFALEEPARLDGERGPRRLLFLQVGAALGSPSSEPAFGDPRESLREVAEADPERLHVQDLSAALRAARVLEEVEDGATDVASALLLLVPQVPRPDVDRNLLEAWARLFAHLRPRSHGQQADTLDDTLTRLVRQGLDDLRSADGVGDIAAALQALDHLVPAFVALEEDIARPLAEEVLEPALGIERRWLKARIATWATRQDRPRDRLLDAEPEPPPSGQVPPALASALDPEWPDPASQPFLEPRVERALILLDDLMSLFASERTWKARHARVRALAVFHVLDLLRHEALPGERLRATIDAYDLTLPDPSATSGERAQRRAALARVLARVVDWEEASGDPLLEARTIHEVDDSLLLLGFVPTGRQPAWLSSMADAIENRFRWRLRRDETFNPVAFLARLTIREPHPALYETLAEVSEDRTYPVPGRDEGFPLTTVARQLGDQARAARRGAPLDEILDAWDPGSLASFDPLARDLAHVRQSLLTLGDTPKPPGERARRLCELVGRTDPRGHATGATILGLLSTMHAANRPVPRAGDPPWTRETLENYLRTASDEAAEVTRLADRLEAGVDVHEMRGLLEQLRSSVTRAVDALVDGLPLAETRLLYDRARAIDDVQARWLSALTAIEDVHDEAIAGGEEEWTQLITVATQRWSGAGLEDVMLQLWRNLLEPQPAPPVPPEPHETWGRRVRLVRWGARVPTREDWPAPARDAWDEQVARAFETLLQEVMEANREDWVTELLEDDAYRRPRSAALVQDTLQAARDWARDRYRPRTSLSARRALAEQRGEDPPGILREAGAFVAHFSPVWSALLVGAIFMLDFGDAWLELAVVGDVRGIVLTCLIGVAGAYLYVVRDLRSKVAPAPGENTGDLQARLLGRSAAFTGLCIVVAAVITTFLWWLLGSSGAVVRGPWAVANIAVWTGFALFVGIVFGLVIQKGI